MANITINGLTAGTIAATDELEYQITAAGASRKTTPTGIVAAGGGLTNPMTTVGDVILGGTAGAATRLAIGGQGTTAVSTGTTLSYIDYVLIAQNAQSAAYTLVLTDRGKHIYHPVADTTARIFTIPANASVAFPIGSAVTFINDVGAGAITIAITTDTLVLFPAGTTGSRTLAAGGMATATKVTATRWVISGVGLT